MSLPMLASVWKLGELQECLSGSCSVVTHLVSSKLTRGDLTKKLMNFCRQQLHLKTNNSTLLKLFNEDINDQLLLLIIYISIQRHFYTLVI